jgi:hypothetical protein
MNKRIKKKHESIVNRAISLINKQLMYGVLDKLRSHGLTPYKVEFPTGYFLFMNQTDYEIMHFKLKELPEFLLGVWNKELTFDNDETKRVPFIFGERECLLDKFKPSRAEWSPLYNDEYIADSKEGQLQTFWEIVDELPGLTKIPWKMTDDDEEEYFKTLKFYEEQEVKTKIVLDKLYDKLKSIMKLHQVDLMFITPEQFFLGNNVYVVIDDALDIDIEELEDKLYNYFSFDFDKDLENIIDKLGFSEAVSTHQDCFILRFSRVLLANKETLKRSETMSRTELNKTYAALDLYSSNFVRLISE